PVAPRGGAAASAARQSRAGGQLRENPELALRLGRRGREQCGNGSYPQPQAQARARADRKCAWSGLSGSRGAGLMSLRKRLLIGIVTMLTILWMAAMGWFLM